MENDDDTGVTAGEDEREEVTEDRSKKEAVEDSIRSFEGTFDWELEAEGNGGTLLLKGEESVLALTRETGDPVGLEDFCFLLGDTLLGET